MKNIILSILFLGLIGCSPIHNQRGFNPENIDFEKIIINKTTKHDIENLLGTPSTTSVFPIKSGNITEYWYYIQQKTEQLSFYKPTITEQLVVTLGFDKEGVLRFYEYKKADHDHSIDIIKDKTESTAHKTDSLRETFGGFGTALTRGME